MADWFVDPLRVPFTVKFFPLPEKMQFVPWLLKSELFCLTVLDIG